ncbi:MAG TPA: response regulator transcription factor [Nitrospiraceae bacterium]|nr:response regulator transcription factor [Nitrospiraceae bacterium]
MVHQDIRIAIFHSHRLFRETLAMTLSLQEGIAVSSEVSSLDQIHGDGAESAADLFLIELSLPPQKCLEQVRLIQTVVPGCKIIMLGVPDNDEAVLACIEVGGVSGYVLENGSFEDVVTNIRAVVAGESVCSPRVANLVFTRVSALARQVNATWANQPQSLTRREQDIIESIEKGLCNKEIAVRLGIEVSTLKNHIHNSIDKLKLQDRRSAVRYVKEHGLTVNHH